MSLVVGELLDRQDRPAYVKFLREAVDDPIETRRQGHYVSKDVDMAHITPAYSKDVLKMEVHDWFENLKVEERNGRIPQEWVEQYHKKYEAFQKGQELPIDGVPIRGWGMISPALQETLIRMNVMTVEDLSQMNDEGMRRVGMGGVDLKNKAKAWLQQIKDKGPLTQEVAELKRENETLKATVEGLQASVESLKQASRLARIAGEAFETPQESMPALSITVNDILDQPPPPQEPRRRVRKSHDTP